MPHVVFYVSSHGYGHAVRTAEVLRALRLLAPTVESEVRTEAPAWIFPEGVSVVRRRLDVGVVQPDSFRVEPRQTLERYAALAKGEGSRIEAEAEDLRSEGVRVVVADVPSAAFPIAARAGVPSIGLANFCWDWIYAPYVRESPQHAPLLKHLRAQHAEADLLLRLPFHGDLSCFGRKLDIPLIARRSEADRTETRRRLGLPLEAPVLLLSFGGFRSSGVNVERLAKLREYAFVATTEDGAAAPAPNVFLLPRDGQPYVDLLAACDAVVTKPGYGIASDCLANDVPVLYTPRGRFREEPIIGQALERLGRAIRLPRAALRRCALRPFLERLLTLDQPWTELRLDGADVAAEQLLTAGGW